MDKAIADAGAAIKLEEKVALAWAVRGMAYAEQGNNKQAGIHFAKAAELDPQFAKIDAAHKQMMDEGNRRVVAAMKLDRRPPVNVRMPCRVSFTESRFTCGFGI